MTVKGYAVLSEVIETVGATVIDQVTAERDKGIDNDYYDEIKELCDRHSIRFCNRKESVATNSLYSIAVSWRWLIHGDINKLVVLHDSLLPKYRGFNPLVTALLKGDTEIGVTAIFANAEFDRGDIISQSAIQVSYPVKLHDVVDRITGCYAALVRDICRDIMQGKQITAVKQDEAKASYSLWRDEQDYLLDWTQDAATIRRHIDSMGAPYKGAKSIVDGKEIRIHDAEVEDDIVIANRTAGKVIWIKDGMPTVVCGVGMLRILRMTDDEGNEFMLTKTRTRFQ